MKKLLFQNPYVTLFTFLFVFFFLSVADMLKSSEINFLPTNKIRAQAKGARKNRKAKNKYVWQENKIQYNINQQPSIIIIIRRTTSCCLILSINTYTHTQPLIILYLLALLFHFRFCQRAQILIIFFNKHMTRIVAVVAVVVVNVCCNRFSYPFDLGLLNFNVCVWVMAAKKK